MKKLISIILAPVLVLCCALPPAGAAENEPGPVTVKNGIFDMIYEKIADAFDKVLFRFARDDSDENTAVIEEDGFSYIAGGYSERSEGAFTIGEGFTAKLYGLNLPFNRMTFAYSSGEPLKLGVTYRSGFKKYTTVYYLEAKEQGEFRCLIEPYLSGGKAQKLISLDVSTCTGKETEFTLSGIKTEKIEKLKDGICYLENSRFKAGVKLGWGGGINYFEDKQCPVDGLANLINQHDTGRLTQQSYYGTPGNDEYEPGMSFDVKWVYNPVQGGDQYGNASRLIDFETSENSIYVKAQPQDWSLDNALTPSYMENTYTLCDDFLRVDNRFTDFSGWEHRLSDQELPAFYTVSYLSRFTWYDGTDSWQGGALKSRDDLKFWGSYASDCTFPFKNGNTETWCAWTSPESGFGVGLYVPNVDVLKAGRFEFNNSKDADNNATNYVAPLKVIKMTSFRPIEYSYLMTTGSTEQIRETFLENKDFTDNASLDENSVSSRTD